jgi:Tol biopolymer transport system component
LSDGTDGPDHGHERQDADLMVKTTKPRTRRPQTGRATPDVARKRNVTSSRRPQRAGHAPKQLILVTCLAFVLAIGLLGWDLTDTWRSGPPSVDGQIAIPVAGGVNIVDTSSGRSRSLIPAEANASVTAVAWSPDRATLAYTLFHRRPDDRVSSAELFTIPASGGSPTLLVPRPQPGTVIDAPAWAPDGSAIFFSFQGVENRQPVARIERYGIADSSRQVVYTDAAFPTVSSDGRSLAFTFDDGSGQALRLGSVAGGDARELVNATAFRGLMSPRFSPDGAWIAFVAQGPGPSTGLGEAPSPQPVLGEAPSRSTGLAAIFSVPVAEAHGDPWGIWKIRPDGKDLQRVGTLQEDEPSIAWSKDGAWIAVHGTGGLWLLDTRGPTEPRRLTDGTIGGIDW